MVRKKGCAVLTQAEKQQSRNWEAAANTLLFTEQGKAMGY
jgi:hypothetical protein